MSKHQPFFGGQAEVEEEGEQLRPPGFVMIRLPWAEEIRQLSIFSKNGDGGGGGVGPLGSCWGGGGAYKNTCRIALLYILSLYFL